MDRNRLQQIRIVSLVALPVLGVVFAPFLLWNRYVFPLDIALFLFFYPLTAMGVTIGFHRMLTHQGFETNRFLKAFFLICGTMAFEGPPLAWAATHIKHHAHSDQEGDPHSPLEGFWHSHFGWLFNLDNFPDVKKYAPHLLEDKTVVWVNKHTKKWMLLSLALPAIIGGWTGFVWGGLVRIFVVNHVTWGVNSICHCIGRRPFEAQDESRNEWVVGLLAFGEGWHNNHHAFPRNAFHGMRWWQFDLSGLIIRGFEKMGLIWEVQRVSEETVQAKLRKAEGIRAAIAEFKEQLGESIALAKKDLAMFLAKVEKNGSISALAVKKLHTVHDETVRKLEEIQRNIEHRRHVRQQKMQAHREEIRELVAVAKERMQQEMQRRVAAVS